MIRRLDEDEMDTYGWIAIGLFALGFGWVIFCPSGAEPLGILAWGAMLPYIVWCYRAFFSVGP